MNSFPEQHRILLIENNPIAQKAHAFILKRWGYVFDVASTGREALALFSEKDFSAIFMDVYLPDMESVAFIHWLRMMEIKTGRKPMPIFIVTASVTDALIKKYLAAGANKVLTKPLSLWDGLLD